MNASIHRKIHLCALAMLVLPFGLAACGHPGPPAAPGASSSTPFARAGAGALHLTAPKVPFDNQPCRSLSQDEQKVLEQKALGYARPVPGNPDRAPADLAQPNICAYAGFQVGYMTEVDYQGNRDGNHSSERTAPSDLPGAFYDKQGGLWIAKNGYYVVISGNHKLDEPVARTIAAKL